MSVEEEAIQRLHGLTAASAIGLSGARLSFLANNDSESPNLHDYVHDLPTDVVEESEPVNSLDPNIRIVRSPEYITRLFTVALEDSPTTSITDGDMPSLMTETSQDITTVPYENQIQQKFAQISPISDIYN